MSAKVQFFLLYFIQNKDFNQFKINVLHLCYMKVGLIILLLFTSSIIGFSQKINGFNFVAERTIIADTGFNDLIKINSNWVAWIPYAFCNVTTGHITFNPKWQWKGESLEGSIQAIQLANEKGIKVMVKPHIWLSDHSFTGTMKLTAPAWKTWKTDYAKYILSFAKIAQEQNVKLLCIGTEQYSSIENDPEYWKQLIKSIRKIYTGEITYAANWDSYKKCTFWGDIDYIGVDAYFPLSDRANPSLMELQRNWLKWKAEFIVLNKKYNKPLLFTEFGYRSTMYTTKEPWKEVKSNNYCETCQANAFQVVFSTFWKEDWFAGGFIWKWFEPNKSVKHEDQKSYFVKEKLAEEMVAKYFRLYGN